MKYRECLGLPPIIPTHFELESIFWRQGTYTGLRSTLPNRTGIKITQGFQGLEPAAVAP